MTQVLKFGGSSVADRPQIDRVLDIVARAQAAGERPFVVSSAHRGITNALVEAAREALRAPDRADPAAPVIARQREISANLDCPPELLEPLFEQLRALLRGLALVGELSPRSLDLASSFGERMSVRCLADYFSRRGCAARAYDAWELGFVTDTNFGAARPLPGFASRVREACATLEPEVVPIVTGFVGRAPTNEITTVGRNGSDLTASLFGAALGAQEVQIWSDTDGVLSADPSLVSSARNIPTMRFDEAAELAYFGSRVLHPSTILPALEANVPVRVRNTNHPDHPGTVIEREPSPPATSCTSIAYKEGQQVLTLRSTRMFGSAGFLAPVFEILGRHGVVVDMISTSEVSVSLTCDDEARLAAALPELRALGECSVERGRSILVVVGRALPFSRGVGAAVLRAIADAGVNVEMISHAHGSINLSLLVRDEDVALAVQTLHRMLFEAEPASV